MVLLSRETDAGGDELNTSVRASVHCCTKIPLETCRRHNVAEYLLNEHLWHPDKRISVIVQIYLTNFVIDFKN